MKVKFYIQGDAPIQETQALLSSNKPLRGFPENYRSLEARAAWASTLKEEHVVVLTDDVFIVQGCTNDVEVEIFVWSSNDWVQLSPTETMQFRYWSIDKILKKGWLGKVPEFPWKEVVYEEYRNLSHRKLCKLPNGLTQKEDARLAELSPIFTEM